MKMSAVKEKRTEKKNLRCLLSGVIILVSGMIILFIKICSEKAKIFRFLCWSHDVLVMVTNKIIRGSIRYIRCYV